MIRRKLLLVGLLVVASAAIAFVGGRAQAARPVPPEVGSAPVAAAKPEPRLSAGKAKPTAKLSATASSAVIYDNLGPGNSYSLPGGWCIDGTAAGCGVFAVEAMPFVGNGGRVTQIDLGLTYFGGTNAAIVQLSADSGGLPGMVLRSWTVEGMPFYGTCCEVTTVTASPSIPVRAGKQYWVAVLPSADDTSEVWNWTADDLQGPFASDLGSGWSSYFDHVSAFRVLGCNKLCKA
jgi:hypothetical protein